MDISRLLREIHELTEILNAGRADAEDILDLEDAIGDAISWVDHGGFKPANYDRVMETARKALLGDAA